jgi:hypothetical protein
MAKKPPVKIIPKGKMAAIAGGAAAGGALLGGGTVYAGTRKKKVEKSFADTAAKVGSTLQAFKPGKIGSFALKPLKSTPAKVVPAPTKAPTGTPTPSFTHYDQGRATQMARQNMKNTFR